MTETSMCGPFMVVGLLDVPMVSGVLGSAHWVPIWVRRPALSPPGAWSRGTGRRGDDADQAAGVVRHQVAAKPRLFMHGAAMPAGVSGLKACNVPVITFLASS